MTDHSAIASSCPGFSSKLGGRESHTAVSPADPVVGVLMALWLAITALVAVFHLLRGEVASLKEGFSAEVVATACCARALGRDLMAVTHWPIQFHSEFGIRCLPPCRGSTEVGMPR